MAKPKFELRKNAPAQYCWFLFDAKGKMLARSPLYRTAAAARRDIEALRGCANTPVVDTTEDQ